MKNSKRPQLKVQEQAIRRAIEYHQNGDLGRAEIEYQRILASNPSNADALHLLGVIALQSAQWDLAAKYISHALDINPSQAAALNNYGIVLKELKQYPRAIEQYLRAIGLNRGDANTYMNLGNVYQAMGDYEKAIGAYDKSMVLEPSFVSVMINKAAAQDKLQRRANSVRILKCALMVNPQDASIHNNLGNIYQSTNQTRCALQCFTRALEINPLFHDAYYNRGNVRRELNQLDSALADYDRAISINAHIPEYYINRGNTQRELLRTKDAYTSFTNAVRISPHDARAYSNRGNAALDQGQVELALADYCCAVVLNPSYAQAYNNRGNALRLLGDRDNARKNYLTAWTLDSSYADALNNIGVILLENLQIEESIDHFNNAISLDPTSADAYFNKANALRELNLFSASIDEYTKALGVKPEYEFLKGLLLHAKMQICDWSHYAELLGDLERSIDCDKKCSPPFPVLALTNSLEQQLRVARLWTQSKFPEKKDHNNFNPIFSRSKKIRVAYFSADFRDHPVSYLMADLFEHHDRSRFEIIAFSLNKAKSDLMIERLKKSFDIWIDALNLSDAQIVEKARSLSLDIAVDLGGYTKNSRTGIFANRVAPAQVSYIGYLGSMGAAYMDYILADKTIIPDRHRSHYSERIAYLPIYQANDSKRVMPQVQMTRAQYALPPAGVVYSCFNTNYKITPQIFNVWMNILKRVPNSVLWVYSDSQIAQDNLRRQALGCEVDSARILFAQRVDQTSYLQRFQLADLFLDTFPYNAGTTASDALWSGLPVLTLQGETFASRIAASILQALEMPELIVDSLLEYENLAVELGRDAQLLSTIKDKLLSNKSKSNLFKTDQFAFELERVYDEMVRRNLQNLGAQDIDLQSA